MNDNNHADFTLSIDPIRDIPFDKYEKNFTFIVDNHEYKTNRFIADFLSPIILKSHYIDESVDSFHITITAQSKSCDFSDFLSFIYFRPTEISNEELGYFLNIFFALGNKKEFLRLMPRSQEETTISNVFEQIRIKLEYFHLFKTNNSHPDCISEGDLINNEINFISSHFYEIDPSEVKKFDTYIIESIVSNRNLRLHDEDSLLRFILDIYTDNPCVSYLFEYVDFMNISSDEFHHFSDVFQIEDINRRIWNSVVERTIKSKAPEHRIKNRRYMFQIKEMNFPYNENKDFNGIFNYLNKRTGGNAHDNGTIEISSNSIFSGCHPKYLIDYNSNSFYEANGKDAWICFDFKDMKVKLTHYTIESFSSCSNSHHLKNWVIEVSDDAVNWSIIDIKINSTLLNGNKLIGSICVGPHDFSRFVRLKQIGDIWGGGNMWFHSFELYGSLICEPY